jgi:metal-responsive CopG/Arc/MetJ family transcriptional regulator
VKAIKVNCPDDLAGELERLVAEGWEDSTEDAIVEAIRRYVRVRRPETLEKHLKEDIAWGLHGRH